MKKVICALSVAVFLTGCGDDSGGFNSAGVITYDNTGFSNIVPTCSAASQRILASVETGMGKAQIRSLVGKPRHVKGERWYYGAAIVNPVPPDFYYITTLQFLNGGLDNVSGDLTLCQSVSPTDLELAFVEAANNYTQQGDTTNYTNEVPTCYDAAVRIASQIEIGMTEEQVRALVGKPVEITGLGVWRYSFGILPAPSVDFSKGSQTSVLSQTVVGYSSISDVCL